MKYEDNHLITSHDENNSSLHHRAKNDILMHQKYIEMLVTIIYLGHGHTYYVVQLIIQYQTLGVQFK